MPKFYKNKKTDKIWWVDNLGEKIGVFEFSFDRIKIYNLFQDYPDKMTAGEVAVFNAENPYWADFFKDRNK